MADEMFLWNNRRPFVVPQLEKGKIKEWDVFIKVNMC